MNHSYNYKHVHRPPYYTQLLLLQVAIIISYQWRSKMIESVGAEILENFSLQLIR